MPLVVDDPPRLMDADEEIRLGSDIFSDEEVPVGRVQLQRHGTGGRCCGR